MKNITVLYHKNCTDGFGAAWAAWKKFGNKAEYIAIEPSALPEKIIKSKTIYVLDSSLNKPDLAKLKKAGHNIVVIDHHQSNKNNVHFASSHLFDLKHSGSVLAWKYFHPSKKIPRLFRHIEDWDLWKYKLPHTKTIGAFMDLLSFDFKTWSSVIPAFEDLKRTKKMIEKGKIILGYEDKLLDTLMKNAEIVEFLGYKTLAINSPIFESQLGNLIQKKMPPIAIVWRQKRGIRTFSLRSNGKVDVSKLAARFGGGGHKASSGFRMNNNKKLPWKYLGNLNA